MVIIGSHYLTVRSYSERSSIKSVYGSRVSAGRLKYDEKQVKIVTLLDKLRANVERFDFDRFSSITTSSEQDIAQRDQVNQRLRGIYLHGPVGSGKTMLMDMFYENTNVTRKKRVHFHQFMLDVHHRIHLLKEQSPLESHDTVIINEPRNVHPIIARSKINMRNKYDPIRFVGKAISQDIKLLCFDEFQVTDVCDAVILTRLFDELWTNGVVLVATSNRPPRDLYLNGLNRFDFLPFIERLEKECIVRNLESNCDYRLLSYNENIKSDEITGNISEQVMPCYLFPNIQENFIKLKMFYENHSKRGNSPGKMDFAVSHNRSITFDRASIIDSICLVSFSELCEKERGASDYHALARGFHTICVYDIPKMSKESHNSARRFITLIDELYNAQAQLVCVAEAPPLELFKSLELNDKCDDTSGAQHFAGEVDDDSQITSGGKYSRNHETSKVSLKLSDQGNDKITFGQQEELSVIESELASIQELSFAFQRAASRLVEMNSSNYLANRKSFFNTNISSE